MLGFGYSQIQSGLVPWQESLYLNGISKIEEATQYTHPSRLT